MVNWLNPLHFTFSKNAFCLLSGIQLFFLFDIGTTLIQKSIETALWQKDHLAGQILVISILVVTAIGMATGILNVVALFRESARLLIPNVLYCTLIFLPMYLNLIFVLAHPQLGWLVMLLVTFTTVTITVTFGMGIHLYRVFSEGSSVLSTQIRPSPHVPEAILL